MRGPLQPFVALAWGVVLVVSPSLGAAEAPGKVAYDRVCGDCHGPEGRGDIAPAIVPLGYDADYIQLIVREGYIQMPPISKREMTDDEVQQVVAYLESLPPEPTDSPEASTPADEDEPGPEPGNGVCREGRGSGRS